MFNAFHLNVFDNQIVSLSAFSLILTLPPNLIETLLNTFANKASPDQTALACLILVCSVLRIEMWSEVNLTNSF